MDIRDLKARMYDLIAAKQRVENEMSQLNQQIIKLQKEEKKEEVKE